MLGLFLWRQATAAEPILPLGLFRIRTLRIGFAVQGPVGMALTGSVVYVIVYLQVARGVGATSAGLFLLPTALGMTTAGLLTGRLARSHRSTVISGTACLTLAMLALATTRTGTDLWLLRAELLPLGLVFGQIVGKLVQHGQPPRHGRRGGHRKWQPPSSAAAQWRSRQA